MKYYIVIILALLTTPIFGQKAKRNIFQTYRHQLPKTYLSDSYNSYSAIFKLNGKKKIYIDGEYVRDSKDMIYNEFWKEEDVFAKLAQSQFLNFEIDPSVKKEDKLLLLVELANARIDAKISEDKDLELPFTYKYTWSIDATTTLTNSMTGDVVFKETTQYGGPYKSIGSGKEKKAALKTYKEAKAHITKHADKSLIGNEFYKKTGIIETYKDNFEVRFYETNLSPFWTISKEKKFPAAIPVNAKIKETLVQIEELNKEFKTGSNAIPTEKIKSLIRNKKAIGFKMSNDTIGLTYRKKFNKLLQTIEDESANLTKVLSGNNKQEKPMLWAMLMNRATVKFYEGKFNEATAILAEAKALNYKKNFTSNLERNITSAQQANDFLMKGRTKNGKEMNPKYFVFRVE